jgi:hypothetical protein
MRGCLVLVGLLVVSIGCSLGGAQTLPAAAGPDVRALAERFVAAVNDDELDSLRPSFDLAGMAKAAVRDVPLEPESKALTEQMLPEGVWQGVEEALAGMLDPRPVELLRTGRDARGEFILLRRWDREAPDYVYLRLKRAAGQPLLVDNVHALLDGDLVASLSDYLRRGAAQDAEQEKANRTAIEIEQLVGTDVEAALAAYAAAPEAVKNDRRLARLLLQMQLHVNDLAPRSLELVEAHRKRFPDDTSVAPRAWKVYAHHERYDEARQMIDQIDRFAGGDPRLDLLRAAVARAEGKADLAGELEAKAHAAAPLPKDP